MMERGHHGIHKREGGGGNETVSFQPRNDDHASVKSVFRKITMISKMKESLRTVTVDRETRTGSSKM